MENKSTVCCDVCKKVFSSQKCLTVHKKNVCYRILDGHFKCEQCGKAFNAAKYLMEHMRNIHKVVNANGNARFLLCSEHPCLDISFPNMKALRNHKKEIHGKDINKTTYTFSSLDEFNHWKETIEAESGIQYHRRGKIGSRFIYHCRRSGIYKGRGAGKRNLKKQGSVKIGRYCTSTLNVSRTENGICIVDYYPNHCGHEIGHETISHTVLTIREKQTIAEKLLQNIPLHKIKEDIKEANIGNKSLLITVKDIRNVAKEFGLKMKMKTKGSKREKERKMKQEACYIPETGTIIENCSVPDFWFQSVDLSNRKLQKVLQPKIYQIAQTDLNSISTPQTASHCKMSNLKYLDQVSAIALHAELYTEYKFSIEQVTELAGQACARAIANLYPIQDSKQVLIVCGPGNNGGDGLVCARHLKLLGYTPCAVYPNNSQNIFYVNLITQCVKYDIPFLQEMPKVDIIDNNCQIIVDAVFGHSFKPPVRPNFVSIINTMQQSKIPIVSVDIPSGWDVNNGPLINSTETPPLEPDMLISLTFPKIAAKFFKGRHHILGGLIVPPALARKYQMDIPRKTELSRIIVQK